MAQFILTDIFMISMGTVLYIVARALPRLDETKEEKKGMLDRLVMSEIPHKIDVFVATTSGKLFRKLKVVLMKVDNYLTERLKTMNTNGNGKPKIDFKEIAASGSIAEEKKEE